MPIEILEKYLIYVEDATNSYFTPLKSSSPSQMFMLLNTELVPGAV